MHKKDRTSESEERLVHMSPYKIKVGNLQVKLVPPPSKLPRKTVKETLEELGEETFGETKTSRTVEKTIPAVERFSVLDKRSFTAKKEGDGRLVIEAWDIPANRHAVEVFEEIRKLKGKEIKPDSKEDLRYAGMELDLNTGCELGRALANAIVLEFEETPTTELDRLLRTEKKEEEWKALKQALSYDPFKNRIVWSPDLSLLREKKAEEAKSGVKYHCANCNILFDGADLNYNLCPKCSQLLEEVVETKLWRIDASLIGKRVRCKAIINGEGSSKAVYVKWSAECTRCQTAIEVDFTSNELRRTFLESLIANGSFGNREALSIIQILPRVGPCQKGQHYWQITPIEPAVNYREVSLQDDLAFEESMEKSITSRNYRIIMFGEPSQTQRIDATGTVILNPKDSTVTLIVDSYTESSPIHMGPLSEDDKALLARYFKNKSLPELLAFSEENVAPSIAGRSEAKLASLLTALSSIWISLDGKTPIPGVLKTLFVGDKRTGKGSILRWWPERVGVGLHGIGESSSRAGLSFFVDPENDMIVWGLLPQGDLGLVAVEALHGLPSEQMIQFREILVQQKVTVRMKSSGARWARTRLIADANPPQSLNRYPYPCIAVGNILCFKDPVDISRWDLFVPFSQADVPEAEVVKVSRCENEEVLATMRKLVSLAWSRKMEHLKITQEAVERLQDESIRLIKQYRLDEIPFIHNGTKWQLLRLASSFAVATLSTQDFENFSVEEPHVNMAVEFLESLLDIWMLQEHKTETEGVELDEMKYQQLKKYFSENESSKKVFLKAVVSPADGQTLSGLLDMPYGSVRNILSELKTKGLVEKHGRGYWGTAMGVQMYRRISGERRADETK